MTSTTKLTCKPGDRFSVSVADGTVEMEITDLRCGDVWNCNPVDRRDEYGTHMVFTDEDLERKIEWERKWR
jgi:hypothetical protein